MAKYILIERTGNEQVTSEYDDKFEALSELHTGWLHMSRADQEKVTDFYVLESANPDEDADNHLDGDFVERVKYNGRYIVYNSYDIPLDYEIIEKKMDVYILGCIEDDLPGAEYDREYQVVYNEYCYRHYDRFGEEFETEAKNYNGKGVI